MVLIFVCFTICEWSPLTLTIMRLYFKNLKRLRRLLGILTNRYNGRESVEFNKLIKFSRKRGQFYYIEAQKKKKSWKIHYNGKNIPRRKYCYIGEPVINGMSILFNISYDKERNNRIRKILFWRDLPTWRHDDDPCRLLFNNYWPWSWIMINLRP